MFDDMKLSSELKQEFAANQMFDEFSFNPLVLTKSIWPLKDTHVNVILPSQMVQYQDAFMSFYIQRHPKKKIQWLHPESRVIAYYSIAQHTYQLICSLYQYLVLEQFNRGKAVVKAQLPDLTGLDAPTVEDVLESFVKLKLIGPSKDGTKYALHPKFRNDSLHLNCLSLLSKKEKKPEELEQTKREIEQTRIMQTYACIIRNMKKSKKLDMMTLKKEVFGQLLQFNPTNAQFKAAIEYCLEKDYLEVVERNLNSVVYKYIEE
jgi:hypothetical protein